MAVQGLVISGLRVGLRPQNYKKIARKIIENTSPPKELLDLWIFFIVFIFFVFLFSEKKTLFYEKAYYTNICRDIFFYAISRMYKRKNRN